MNKTVKLMILTLLIIGLLCFNLSVSAESDKNLIRNGSFELTDRDGYPADWYSDAYILDQGYSVFSIIQDENAIDGEHYANIRNLAMNDARYAQEVTVEPDSIYKLSGWIKADIMDSGRGANLSVAGIYAFSESIFYTNDDWQYIEWYGETGEDQRSVTVFVRVGGYSGESKGYAFFDDIRMEKVDSIPGSVTASLWFSQDTYSDADDSYNDYYDESENKSGSFGNGMLILMIISAISGIIALILLHSLRDNDLELPLSHQTEHRNYGIVFVLIFAAFAYRFVLSCLVSGYEVDVNCFLSWGNTMKTAGPLSFYESTGFCDYPPAYIYILGFNSFLSSLIKNIIPTVNTSLIDRCVFRLVPSLCDIATCLLIYSYAIRNRIDRKKAGIFSALLAFCPFTVIISAAWGQMDSVLGLCLLCVAIAVMEHKWIKALPFYMLAVLVKPQALMLGFLGLTSIIIEWIKEPENRRSILIGLGLSAAVLLVVVTPFSIHMTPDWLIKQYSETLSSYPYATVNTANFYYIFNGNWSALENSAPSLSVVILLIMTLASSSYLFVRQKNKGLKYYAAEPAVQLVCAAGYLIALLTSGTWTVIGIIAMVQAFLFTLPMMIRSGDVCKLPLLGGVLFILLYVFGIKMHERYLFPAFILLALAYISNRDKRILWILYMLVCTTFINIFIVLNNSILFGSSYGHLNQDTKALAYVLSALNILSAIYAVNVSWHICVGGEGTGGTIFNRTKTHFSAYVPEKSCSFLNYKPDKLLHWKKADTMIVATITLLYSVLSLTALGSTKSPQTSWISTDEDECIVLELDSYYEDFSILYFAGVSRYNFSVRVSDDNRSWSDPYPCEMDQGQCYKWKYAMPSWKDNEGNVSFSSGTTQSDVLTLSGRYIRITADQIGLTLNEVLFRAADGSTIPVKVSSRYGENGSSPNLSDPQNLIDEQDSLVGIPTIFRSESLTNTQNIWRSDTPQPSWYNSTYFDEIYHARTAYEHLHGTAPYETSHPPLGKLLMSVFIAIFGMTPFGWRFAGALAGILMLPGIYLLCKQLTKSTSLSGLACALLSLDCMHFTQTRIATIDSFPVLFIIFAYFFMLRFIQTDLQKTPIRVYLHDLAMCGLFMGLSIASKWIGIYAGAGLAILFFNHCLKHFRLAKEAAKFSRSDKINQYKDILAPYNENGFSFRNPFTGRFLVTCGWCILFFILIPLLIYILSYIPYFAYNRQLNTLPKYLHAVLDAQTGMFNYHSTPGLGMDHPFYSPWYEWPLITRPMYYAMDGWLADEKICYAIFAFGNPVVWIGGLFGIICVFIFALFRKHYQKAGSGISWHLWSPDHSNVYFFVITAFLAQFLPWVLVPRGTYIYHYFASIPFLIISLTVSLKHIRIHSGKIYRVLFLFTLLFAVCMFILFFPYASGMPVPDKWLDLAGKFMHLYH